ncbi:oligopeptidase B [Povalibacter uvarum]|uniref:Oligopeptidase B n=1 Tax=Povalibacter uvarum TaxID=732238 RepID=A0A841HKA2_9GAMM|nr:S9 family peptidase [Povalibacter uvarum]MBB6092730.1 oligopeptidase B [Povalibacter uvarum]
MLSPPKAVMRAHRVESPNGSREDPYYWLRDDARSDADVIAHLRAENTHTDAVLEPIQPLIEAVYREIIGRLKQDDASVPARYRGYWYWARYETGREYPIYMRRADGADDGEAVVLLDGNAMAEGHPFFQLANYEVSPDNQLTVYAVDTVGRRQFQLRVKDLRTGELLPDIIENAEADIAWLDDNRTFLYIEKDPVTLLGRRVRRHLLGSSQPDPVVYEEPDESFGLAVERSKSERYVFIGSESTTSSEWRFAAADDLGTTFEVFAPREEDHEYQVDHLDDRFFVRSNWKAQNFCVAAVGVASRADHGRPDRWESIVPHDPQVLVQDFELFREFLAVSERSGGLSKIRFQRWGEPARHLAADDPAYTMHLGSNPEMDSTVLRYVYTSLTTPTSTFDYDIRSGNRTLLKREPVLGEFDPANYASEFLWADARDGQRVPVSVVYRKDTPRDGSAPLFLYAYGSYGLSMDPAFSSARLSLLDRGFIYAIAHVRGGQEMGRHWYDTGRLLNKWNTFQDFIDVTQFLIAQRYATAGRIYASGGSAGGLLIGTVINTAPQLYGGAVANVPFVDIVTTMLDESIPLTTLEYDEWGNPNEADFYRYMLSYSPYDNVRAQDYPPLLVTTGLWDSQVQYYEPAKWVARLRERRTNESPLLLHTNMEAGHGGQSGRFQRLREVAREYGFVIALARSEPGARGLGPGRETDSISTRAPSPGSRAPRGAS